MCPHCGGTDVYVHVQSSGHILHAIVEGRVKHVIADHVVCSGCGHLFHANGAVEAEPDAPAAAVPVDAPAAVVADPGAAVPGNAGAENPAASDAAVAGDPAAAVQA